MYYSAQTGENLDLPIGADHPKVRELAAVSPQHVP
jgi:hypothetical protein